jgi:hypothetical protein
MNEEAYDWLMHSDSWMDDYNEEYFRHAEEYDDFL